MSLLAKQCEYSPVEGTHSPMVSQGWHLSASCADRSNGTYTLHIWEGITIDNQS